ncbi:tumor necrosis factor receptor superfamily member 21 [Periophthalmus magnuspinnatus]|uniref:tumor necrosis factor receptor superfamily member 21 n=1 Tax=Periophthalmus magnuspinnatus TaxID=409849 RepID=UPI0024371381|nr:tumor necrosis factor receptor superfamily member 21 [Periophthalmus magnuspinnatus]
MSRVRSDLCTGLEVTERSMAAACVSAVLLCSAVVSARVLSPPENPPVLSPRKYQHTDASSGAQLACDKCPAGTYVSAHCSLSAERECAPCPDETYTRGENGVQQCHRCREPCPQGLVEKTPCTATQDRVCTCPTGTFLSEGMCRSHSLCPPGTRVKKRGSDTEDVLCKACSKGTFSDVPTSAVKCRTHQDCPSQGLELLVPGTRETDNVCGLPSAHSSTGVSLTTLSVLPISSTPPPKTTASPPGPERAEPLQDTPSFSSVPSSELSSHVRSSSSLHNSIAEHGNRGFHHHSANIQLRRTMNAQVQNAQLLDHTSTSSVPNQNPTRTPLSPEHQLSQQNSGPLPGPNRKSMDILESIDTVKIGAGINKVPGGVSGSYRPTRRGSPRPSSTEHFDINEHLPWMIVLLLLLVLVVIVGCSVKRSSRVLKKGPMQDPSSIVEKAIHKKAHGPPTQTREKWIYYSNGQGVDILELVAAHVGSQWIDLYQVLANATEREVAAFSNGYVSDPERAYAALQHWTIRDSDANLAKLINALHRHRRIDVVEKVRCVMEDNPQFDLNQLMPSVNGSQSLSPIHRPLESPSFNSVGGSSNSVGGSSVGGSSVGGASVGGTSGVGMEASPIDRAKGFFPDESEPLLRCDSTSSKDSGLSRNGSFITKEKKDTVLRQVRLDPCDLQPIFDDMLHILNPEELHTLEQIPTAEDKLDRLFEIAGVKSQEASQTLLDSVYCHLPDLL